MRAVVTGGAGFLGGAIVQQLIARGDRVHSVSRGQHAHLAELGVASSQIDLGDPGAASLLEPVFAGADVVFHCAAKAGVWGTRESYTRANVDGTQAVIDACRRAGVTRLVHTSSPSACFDGSDHRNASNDVPLATHFLAPYPESKARAERIVLAARGPDLAATILRPHLLFGPGDPHILPRLVARARRRFFRLPIVGDGENEVSLTFIDNGAAAHIAAADALQVGSTNDGRAYFLGQKEHVRLWPWIANLVAELGLPELKRHVSLRTATRVGAVCESLWKWMSLSGEPPMTRFVAQQLATDHSYDLTPAEQDFGYVEQVTLDEATRRSIEWLRNLG